MGSELSRILFLKIYRTEIVEIGMTALPVVKYFNAINNVRLRFLTVIVKLVVN